MADVLDLEPQKRKRDADDNGRELQQGTIATRVNYLTTSNTERLNLINGDPDIFGDILNLMSQYESVIERNESLAASLGAKLHGPRLLKGIDKFFEGSIKTNTPQSLFHPISWVDVCTFAKSNPNGFVLTSMPDGTRGCQFVCRGVQVMITEDDWRFISSGALNRIPFEHPLEEDETAELATLDILEQRASMLYKKADEVAARARILHHKLGLRKQEIARQRQTHESSAGSKFQSVNQPRRTSQGPSYDIHKDLLHQFVSTTPSGALSRSTSGAGMSQGPASPSLTATSQQPRLSTSGRSTATDDSQADAFRSLIGQKIDKLSRGDAINPPCDRCRRLKLQCVKYLTACQGCTKKHAKCVWKSVAEEEAAQVKREMGVTSEGDAEIQADRDVASPHSGVRVHSDLVLGPMVTTEGARSGGGDPNGQTLPGTHSILTSRYELPPMRIRTSLLQGQGHSQGQGGSRSSTPQSQNQFQYH